MQKIISLFQRNYDGNRLVRNEVTPGAEWVIAGEGIATQKHDGTCCLIRDEKLYKRYEASYVMSQDHGFDDVPGPAWVAKKPIPINFEDVSGIDPQTGKSQGWVPVGTGNEDRWHREAFGELAIYHELINGTYELCGPKIQGNPEKFKSHILIRHGEVEMPWFPRTFDAIRDAFIREKEMQIEGVVWHHPDGRMVKIKSKDFGVSRSR